jgi:hypothetical protein
MTREQPNYSKKKPSAPRPVGHPVSRALDTTGHPIRARLDRTLLRIRRVHGTGSVALPRIPVLQEPQPQFRESTFARTNTTPSQPRWIRVWDQSQVAELGLVHEIGHFLERFGIPGHQDGNRPYATDPTLAGWLAAIQASGAYARLGQLRGPGVDPAKVAYLLHESELWARSYAQYIATRTRDKILLRQLDLYRVKQKVYNDAQWDDADFTPIAAAMDQLFQSIPVNRMALMIPTQAHAQTQSPQKPHSGDPSRDDTGLERLLDAVAAGLITGDDIVVEEKDGKLYEVFPDGRRKPIPD